MGNNLSESETIPAELTQFIRQTERLDGILKTWESSDSFSQALSHADIGTSLMKMLVRKNRESNVTTMDTPFFGYCCCQIVKVVN